MNATYLKSKHDAGLDYETYLASDPDKGDNGRTIGAQVTLSDPQRALIEGFAREMKVLVVSGIWCGDCVQQGPLLERIAEANPMIKQKWIDRDEHADLA